MTISSAPGMPHTTDASYQNQDNASNEDAASASANGVDKTAENKSSLFIIRGETHAGKKFRPSDWCERLHGTLRVLGDETEKVMKYVHLVNHEGQKCILIDCKLEDIHPKVYDFFTCFAKDNQLAIQSLSWQEWNTQHG